LEENEIILSEIKENLKFLLQDLISRFMYLCNR